MMTMVKPTRADRGVLVSTAQKAVEIASDWITPELRFAALHYPIRDAVPLLASGPGYPPASAAWLLAMQRELNLLNSISLPVAPPTQTKGSGTPELTHIELASAPELGKIDPKLFARVTRSAVVTLQSLPALDECLWKPSPSGEGAEADALLALTHLGNGISWVVSSAQQFVTRRNRENAGEDWYGLAQAALQLRSTIPFVRELCGKVKTLDEYSVPLDQRWFTRVTILLNDSLGLVGTAVDIPTVVKRPGVKARHLFDASTEFVTSLDEVQGRRRELAAVLLARRNSPPPPADSHQLAKPAAWYVKATVNSPNPIKAADLIRLSNKNRSVACRPGSSKDHRQYYFAWVCGLPQYRAHAAQLHKVLLDAKPLRLREPARSRAGTNSHSSGASRAGKPRKPRKPT